MNKYSVENDIVKAQYSKPLQILYKGNPLIEALPTLNTLEDIYENIKFLPTYSEDERKYGYFDRMACIQLLYRCFQPWSTHIEIFQRILNAIREGYVTRNPVNINTNKDLSELYNCVQSRDSDFRNAHLTTPSAPGFSIIGDSGMGKSTAVERALSLFPQVIIHDNYNGKPFSHSQIVWMKLECPHDGSVKGLCFNFLSKFDEILKDTTSQKYKAYTTDQLIPAMALIARRHSLGVLVIDEIQNINAAKSGGAEKMMNFIVNLINTIGVPVVLIGTKEAVGVINTNLMTARRCSGQQGNIIMDNLKKGSKDWNLFIRGIWEYQWTAEPTEIKQDLTDALYDGSFGIVGIAVMLYERAQRKAIQRGEAGKSEKITPELIKSIANSKEFKMIRDNLNILRNQQIIENRNSGVSLAQQQSVPKKDTKFGSKNTGVAKNIRNEELQQQVAIPRINENVDTENNIAALIKEEENSDETIADILYQNDKIVKINDAF